MAVRTMVRYDFVLRLSGWLIWRESLISPERKSIPMLAKRSYAATNLAIVEKSQVVAVSERRLCKCIILVLRH